MWVYSGRRGIHCWVADENARKLNSQARNTIAEYISIIKVIHCSDDNNLFKSENLIFLK